MTITHGDCAWCGETIHDDDDFVTVIDGEPQRDARIRAAFHRGTCFGEASSYGWD